MTTVKEFRDLGVEFIGLDVVSEIYFDKYNLEKINCGAWPNVTVNSFAPRKNTGKQPVGDDVMVDVLHSGKWCFHKRADGWSWCLAGNITEWKPSLNQPSADQSNTQHKCGCISCNNDATHTWSGHPTCDKCRTPQDVLQTETPEEKEIFDKMKASTTIGSGVSTGTHSNDKERPIFTKAMADAGELPPVGSLVRLETSDGDISAIILAYDSGVAWVKNFTGGHNEYDSRFWKVHPPKTKQETAVYNALDILDKEMNLHLMALSVLKVVNQALKILVKAGRLK